MLQTTLSAVISFFFLVCNTMTIEAKSDLMHINKMVTFCPKDTVIVSTEDQLNVAIKNDRVILIDCVKLHLTKPLFLIKYKNLSLIAKSHSELIIPSHLNHTVIMQDFFYIELCNLKLGSKDKSLNVNPHGVVLIIGCLDILMNNSFIYMSGTFGLIIKKSQKIQIIDCMISDAGVMLFELEQSSNIIFSNVTFIDNFLST